MLMDELNTLPKELRHLAMQIEERFILVSQKIGKPWLWVFPCIRAMVSGARRISNWLAELPRG
jgi:hypothetical protein